MAKDVGHPLDCAVQLHELDERLTIALFENVDETFWAIYLDGRMVDTVQAVETKRGNRSVYEPPIGYAIALCERLIHEQRDMPENME